MNGLFQIWFPYGIATGTFSNVETYYVTTSGTTASPTENKRKSKKSNKTVGKKAKRTAKRLGNKKRKSS